MQGPNVDDNSQQLAQLCRGRLVLAMQSWLWRGQAWLHAPSWASKPEAPLSLPIQDAALRGLRESLHMNDEDLLHTCNYLIVVRASFLAPQKLQRPRTLCSLAQACHPGLNVSVL